MSFLFRDSRAYTQTQKNLVLNSSWKPTQQVLTFKASARAGRASSRSFWALAAISLHCSSSALIFSLSSLTT